MRDKCAQARTDRPASAWTHARCCFSPARSGDWRPLKRTRSPCQTSVETIARGGGGCAPVPITESPREPAASGSHVPLADEARRPGARGSNMGSVCSRTRGPAPRCARPCLRADVDDSRRRTSPDDHATHVQCSKACASRRARSVSRYDCPTRVERLRSTHPFRANSDSVTAYGSRQRTDSARPGA